MSDDKTKPQIISFEPSTLETIDYAVYNWINEELEIFCNTNKGWKKVPVVWVAGERAWQVKNHKDLRDDDGALIFPIMTVERTGMIKDLAKKGVFYGNVYPKNDKKGGSITITRRIKQDKTANFANATSARRSLQDPPVGGKIDPPDPNFPFPPNKKIVYETITIPMPVYVDVSYDISIRTEYQQQMNQIVQPFATKTGGINLVPLEYGEHQYEGFLQSDFAENDNITELGEETRIYETKIPLKVLGYLVGADKNNKQPQIVIRENAVEMSIPRERCMLGEDPPWAQGKYRCH